jgi:hypothetical protein
MCKKSCNYEMFASECTKFQLRNSSLFLVLVGLEFVSICDVKQLPVLAFLSPDFV